MKSYEFANIIVREPLIGVDYGDPSIVPDNAKLIINLTENYHDEPTKITNERKIRVFHRSFKNEENRIEKILDCVERLAWYENPSRQAIVFCDSDMEYSSAIIEAYHLYKMRTHLIDEYQGYKNHLEYLCETGFFPPLIKIEYEIKRMRDMCDPAVKEELKERIRRTSTKCFNSLAQKTNQFVKAIDSLKVGDDKYKDLSPIMSCFRQVKIKEGYVLDGFQSGSTFATHMLLHARKADGVEFIPFDFRLYELRVFLAIDNEEESNEIEQRLEHWRSKFNDSMYARKPVHMDLADKIVRPIWEDITVPFNEEGIWEAILLYLAPMLMPGGWHWSYSRIRPVISKYTLVKECKTIDDYEAYLNSDIIPPRVEIISEKEAKATFVTWGRYGLRLRELSIFKDGKSVRIESAENSPKDLIYYKPDYWV